MGSQVLLFVCYPLALFAGMFGGAVAMSRDYSGLAFGICAGFYALLFVSLRGCARVGGWAGWFYRSAMIGLGLHLVPALLILTALNRSMAAQMTALVGVYGVYLCCSLAGAELACRKGKRLQAFAQVSWPVLFVGVPWLASYWPQSGSAQAFVFLFPLFAFGLQGLQALLLALAPAKLVWEYVEPPPEIGWEHPGGLSHPGRRENRR